ncbi:MAG: FHA domain-containing protein [Deltaproteobacteria bacterium]
MDVRLVVAHARADAKQIALHSETLIGRSPECNLRIASGQVSRKHCLIKVAEGHVSVRDLGSANGTRLNGQTITTEVDVPVAPGSTLVVGPLKFIVQFTAPKVDEDTELLTHDSSGGSSDLRELQQMATAPVVDGEETKDYPPSRARGHGAGVPAVISDNPAAESDREGNAGGQGPSPQARTTEAEFEGVANETVFDGEFAGENLAGRAASGRRPDAGEGTDLIFEEDDLRQLAAAIDGNEAAPPVAQSPAGPDASSLETAPADPPEKRGGWGLLEMLRRKKKPAAREPAAPPPDDDDESLSNFLKDQ